MKAVNFTEKFANLYRKSTACVRELHSHILQNKNPNLSVRV